MTDVSVTTFVLAGSPGSHGFAVRATPTPPSPQPGPYGNHEYEVVICDKYGIAYGIVPNAVPTQIDWDLDAVGQALIDVPIQDPAFAALLPISTIPGVREIQIWRDQVLIFWGWPTSATYDSAQVHLTCSSLEWVLGQREFGPGYIYELLNPQFEQGLEAWTPVNVEAMPDNVTVALGEFSARLIQTDAGEESYLSQTVTLDLTARSTGIAFALSAWCYLDANYAYTGPANLQRGLYIGDNFGNISDCDIPAGFPFNTWTRLEVQPTDPDPCVIAQPGVITEFEIRLYCPGGSIVWDAVNFKAYENVSVSPSPPATAWDVADIIETILESAQQPFWTKSDLAFDFYGAATGVYLNRIYYSDTNQVILDAINEFPSIGVCDFCMTWDETGHYRGLQIYSPAKGMVKYNVVIDPSVNETTQLNGAVDGSQVGTVWRILGQGSTGPAEDLGFAAFASNLGGRIVDGAAVVAGNTTLETSTPQFTADDVGEIVYSLGGLFLPGTYIVSYTNSTHVVLSTPSQLNAIGFQLGIGGITLDQSAAALPDQPISTLQATALTNLLQTKQALALPAPRIRADGPNGLFGLIETGDIVFASADYGWLQIPPTAVRVSKLSLYPPTEELEPTLMPLNQAVGS